MENQNLRLNLYVGQDHLGRQEHSALMERGRSQVQGGGQFNGVRILTGQKKLFFFSNSLEW